MAEITASEYATLATLAATFIVQTATNAPPNAQVLSSLGTGLVKVASGVLSLGGSGTDYELPLTFNTGLTRSANTITNDLTVGKAGGQTATGGTGSGDGLVLRSTSNATKGFTSLGGTSIFTVDETNTRIGIGTSAPECALKIGNTSLGLNAFFGASSLPCLVGVQQASGTFPGIVMGNDSTHQIRIYWQDSSAQIATSGGVLDISPATAVTFYTSTGGRISNDGSWLVGNIGTNAQSKLRFTGTRTLATGAGLTWDSFDLTASTLTLTGSTNVTTATGLNFVNVGQPTYTDASAVTVTNAATMYIANAPAAAGSVTITNAYALWVDNGAVRLDGNVGFFATAPAAQQTSGANLTNNVTSGGSTDVIADFTSLSVYATDAATIRNDIFQLARKLKQINDGLRLFGLFT